MHSAKYSGITGFLHKNRGWYCAKPFYPRRINISVRNYCVVLTMEDVGVGAVEEPLGGTPEVRVFKDGETSVVVARHGRMVEAAVFDGTQLQAHIQRWEEDGETVQRAVEV